MHGRVTTTLLRFVVMICTMASMLVMPRAAYAESARKPNILVVLLDNLGWGELGCYGGGALRGAPTPHIDRIAGEGLRLTNFNVETSCTPSRSDLLTGRFAVRSGTLRSSSTGLVDWEVTLPQLLHDRGYRTAMFGKWHLGDEQGRYPNDRGFDSWYGIPRTSNEALARTSPGYDPAVVAPMYIMEGQRGGISKPVTEYTMEARRNIDGELVDRTIRYIADSKAANKPFFAYVPMTQVHLPSVPSKAFEGRTGYGDFADSVVQTDFLVGKLVDALDRMGLAKDTVVVIASDNGAEWRTEWRGTSGPWSGTYQTMMEGGLRAPFIVRWPGQIAPRVSNEMVHIADLFTTLAEIGGAPIPTDRPIDGLDVGAFFTGKAEHSPRQGFPVYVEGKFYGAKWRDWKYHIVWQPDPRSEAVTPPKPYLFNVVVDPKEEKPRTGWEDYWVAQPIKALIAEMEASLKRYPPVPFGSAKSYVPRPSVPAADRSDR